MVKAKAVLIVVLGIVLIFSCSKESTEPSAEVNVVGQILNDSNDPVYGAKISVGATSVMTNADGSFSIKVAAKQTHMLKIEAPGYVPLQFSVSVDTDDDDLGTIVLESLNNNILQQIFPIESYTNVQWMFESVGFVIDNNPSSNQGFADAHLNMLLTLEDLNKTFTLEEIVDELNESGVRDGQGNFLYTTDFINTLQALYSAAFQKPHDPRSLLFLILMSDENGNLPSSVPVLTSDYSLSAAKALLLMSAVRFVSEHPPTDINLSKMGNFPKANGSQHPEDLVQDIITAWFNIPVYSGNFGQDVSGLIGSTVGSFVGLYVGYTISMGLTFVFPPAAVLTPYIVQGSIVTGAVFGGWLATELYKMWLNRLGDYFSPDDVSNVVIGEDGNLIIQSDIRVTLTWEGGPLTDVDIHLIDPNGERTYYGNPVSSIGAELDVDDVDGYGPENITLEPGEAINGNYTVEVNFYDDEGAPGQPVVCTVVVTLHEGSANEIRRTFGPHTIIKPDYNGNDPDAWWTVTTFSYPDGTFSKAAPIMTDRKLLPKVQK